MNAIAIFSLISVQRTTKGRCMGSMSTASKRHIEVFAYIHLKGRLQTSRRRVSNTQFSLVPELGFVLVFPYQVKNQSFIIVSTYAKLHALGAIHVNANARASPRVAASRRVLPLHENQGLGY